jgi:phosphoadenosine phosphosulfate reductase
MFNSTSSSPREDCVARAIRRLQEFVPNDGDCYWLAFSGGKDSQCIYHLAKEAGVPFEAHYNVTSADPPELVQFIKKYYPDVKRDLPEYSMWQLIPHERRPFTRLARYCCKSLKERGGDGRVVVTGVRWAESVSRKKRRAVAEIQETGKEIILLNDNDSRKMTEFCPIKGRRLVNPIIDWEDKDVWNFIRSRNLPYCSLYDEGWTRLGCIGCPQGGGKHMRRQFKRWPKYRDNYLRAFEKMLEVRRERGMPTTWQTAEEVMKWWTEEPEYPLWEGIESGGIQQEDE